MRFQQYLTEKLKLSQFREYVKAWKENNNDKMFDKLFGKKHRIYEPYEGGPLTKSHKGEIEERIEDVLMAIDGGWEIVDYEKGIAIAHGKERKIGKILQNAIDKRKKNNLNTDFLTGALKAFINDKNRTLTKTTKLLICYSRHAYDIAGMSTDRGWTSCMTLPGDKNKPEGGCNWHLVGNEASEGCLIAYLIKEDDKNLEHPIGRVMIKPYAHVTNYKLHWVVGDRGYGTTPRKFFEQVEKWVKNHLNGEEPKGLYNLSTGFERSDFPSTILGKNSVMITKWADMLKLYADFYNAEDYSHMGYAEFMIQDELVFVLEAIFDDLSIKEPKDVVRDLVSLIEKDEWDADEFIAKIMSVFNYFHQSRKVLLPVRAVGLVVKLIQKDLEREIFDEDYTEIEDIIEGRKLIRNYDDFKYYNTGDLKEILKLTKPYIDRLYKVYG